MTLLPVRLLSWRSLQSRPLRSLLSMLGVMIGVAGIVAIGISNRAAMDSITHLFAESAGRADLTVTSAAGDGNVSDGVFRSLSRWPAVKHAVPLVHLNTALADDQPAALELSFLGAGSAGLLLHGVDPALEPLVRDYRITSGRQVSGEAGAYEAVLVEEYARDEGIAVGDRVGIVTVAGVERLRVVGLMAREGAGQSNNGRFGVLPLETAQRITGRRDGYDQVDLVLAGNAGKDPEPVRAALQARVGAAYAVTFPAGQGQRMTQMLANYQIGLNFLSGIALFVGAFLIYNAFAMNVVERTREFGMLRAIGMTRGQMLVLVIVEAVLMGLLGSAAGVALGVLGAQGLAALMGQLMGTGIAGLAAPDPDTLLMGLAVGVGVTILAATLPAIQAGRISPVEALRIRGATREGWLMRRGWVLGLALMVLATAVLIWNPFPNDPQFRLGSMTVFMMFTGITLAIPAGVTLWERAMRPVTRRLYGASGVIGSRNIDRARLRTTLTVGALLIGVAMILVVRTMTASFSADLTEWIASYLGGDLYVHSNVPLRADLAQQIAGIEGIGAATPVHYQTVEYRRPGGQYESLTFMAVDPATYVQVTGFVFRGDAAGSGAARAAALRELADGEAVLVSSVLAEKYGLSRGDTMALRTRSGVRSFRVAETVVDFNNQGLVITGNRQDLRRFFGSRQVSTILVRVAAGDATGIAEAARRIDALYGKRYRLSIESNAAIRERISGLLRQAFSMFDVMGVLAVAVASLGVVNTLTMNVMERTREIGMLRAVGMTRGQVTGMVLAESALMGVIGGVLGLGFGLLLARLFMAGMTAMSGYRLTFLVPPEGIASALIVSLLVSQLAALGPARRAGRTNVLDALHYE